MTTDQGRWHWEQRPSETPEAPATGSDPGDAGPVRLLQPAAAGPRVEALGHQPGLDGLRALALAAVLFYHARFGWATGGFLGVSLFFTLSGFLITSLLIREGFRSDAVDMRRFWSRRFRRLIPASWATIALVVVMGVVGVWNSDQLRDLRGDVPYALAQIINWHFIVEGRTYGAGFQAPSPLEHFWSLAIEEQFYLFLPLLVVALLALERRRGGRSVRFLAITFAVMGAGSALLNGALAGSGTDAAYFGTFSRIFELLAGSLLACALLRGTRMASAGTRTAASVLGVVGLVVTVAFWHLVTLGSRWMYPIGFLVVAASSCALILGAMQGGVLTRVLALKPLVWLGGISYGVYLLHWPVFLWLNPERVRWSPWPLFALRMAVTLTAATLMFRFLERPVRFGGLVPARSARVVMPAALVVLLLATGLVTAGLSAPGNLQRAAATPTSAAPRPLEVVVVGDELAASLDGHGDVGGRTPMHVTVVATPGCGLAVGGWVRRTDGGYERDVDRCGSAHRGWVDRVAELHPDVVLVWAGLRDVADRRLGHDTPWSHVGDPRIDDFLRADASDLLGQIGALGPKVVVLSAPPMRNTAPAPAVVPTTLPQDPAEADLKRVETSMIGEGIPAPGWAENDDARVPAWNAVLASAAAASGATYLDAAAEMATWRGGALDPAWRSSGVGLTPEGAAKLADWLAPELRDLRPPPQAPPPPSVLDDAAPMPAAPAPVPRRNVPPGRQVHVTVVGDSVALGVGYGLQQWSKGHPDARVVNSALLGCPIARGGSYRYLRDVATFRAECDWAERFGRLVQDQRPDVVVLMSGIWEVVDRRFPQDDRWRHIGQPEVDRYILREFLSAIDVLGADGANVVLLTYPHFQAGAELGFTDLPESDPTRVDRLNELLREAAAARPGVARVVDLQGWYAQLPGGEADLSRRPDGLHFTDGFVPTIGSWLGPQLVGVGRNPVA